MSSEQKVIRKLRAILSADVKGYSLLMADDEVHTIQMLKAYRSLMSNLIQQHSGRVVDNPGDNLLAEFSSAVDAVECAVEVQKKLKKENARYVEDNRLEFRIGINIGDVVHDDDRIYGSGVNVAARIEGLASAGGICISRNTYDQVKDKLDLEFEYIGEHEVKNIEEPVRVYKVILDADAPKPLIEEHLELPDIPSIAVLPFDNMSGDPGQEYFSDGMTDQIIHGLCKIPNLFVIARNSSFAFKGRNVSVKQVATELGVRYILEGSVQRACERLRITAQLIDATTNYHVWSETYDRDLSDIFALQDEITMKLIEAMQVKLTVGEQASSWGIEKTNIHAFDKCAQGLDYLFKLNKKNIKYARRLFKDAIDIDSKYSVAYVLIAASHVMEVAISSSKSPNRSLEQAEIFVKKALVLNKSLDIAYSMLCRILLHKNQLDASRKAGERAIELNPNSADGHIQLGNTLMRMGDTKKAVRLIEQSLRLNPFPPINQYIDLGIAYASDGQYENSIYSCKNAIKVNPKYPGSYVYVIFSYMMLKQDEKAHEYKNALLGIIPKYSLKRLRTQMLSSNQPDTEEIIKILRKAGLPD